MPKDFHQIAWDESLDRDWTALLRLAVAEDFGGQGDWTTNALVDPEATGRASVIARQAGVVQPAPQQTPAEVEPQRPNGGGIIIHRELEVSMTPQIA